MITRLRFAPFVAAVILGLTACGSSDSAETSPSPIGGDVITPLTKDANDLQGSTVELIVGQVLSINTGDLAVDSYTGTVTDAAIAEFTPGRSDGSAEFNPGITALAVGETSATLTNSDGGIQPLTFTVVVGEK